MPARKNFKKRSGKSSKKQEKKSSKNKKVSTRVKYRFICQADEFLTQYNLEQNKKVYDRCVQDPKFNVHLSCFNHEDGKMCPYLEVKKIG